MSLYSLLKFAHVLLAIVAVGFNASYAIWIARAARESAHLSHILRGIKNLDDRFANPAYGLLLLTGLAMAFLVKLPLTTFWVAGALVLWLLAMGLGVGAYTPTLRRQIQALEEEEGANSPGFQRLSQQGTILGIVLAVIVIVIVFLMVVKPVL